MIELKILIIENGDELNIGSSPTLTNATESEREALTRIVNLIVFSQPNPITKVVEGEAAQIHIEKLKKDGDSFSDNFKDITEG